MSQTTSILLALFAALCFGLAPLLGKMGLQIINPATGQSMDPLTGLALRSFTVSGCLLLILALTGGYRQFAHATPRAIGLLALEGLLAALIGHYAYLYALKYSEASRVVPAVFAAVPAVAFLGGMLFLHEKPSATKVAGLLLVMAGILVFRLAPKETNRPAQKPPAAAPLEAPHR